MEGGKKYGEGVYGVTYDFACKLNDNDTLCRMLKERRVSSVQLHSFDNSVELDRPNEIAHFIRYIHDLDCCVAKVFKSYMIGFDKKGFTEELDGIKTIYNIFGKDTEKETTLTSMKLYGFNFEAAYIVFVDGSHIYVTFSKKCESTLEKTPMNSKGLKRLAANILGTMVRMQEHGFAHCDVKPDNIIYCKRLRRFKLIDWGLAKYLREDSRLAGTVMFGCPLAHYLSGYPELLAPRLMYMSAWKRDSGWFNSAVFQDLYKIIYEEFGQVVDEGDERSLLDKYGKKFDVFALGMCMGWVVWKHGLKWKKHRRLVTDMVSMRGLMDARSALAALQA